MILYNIISSPIGNIKISASVNGITSVNFTEENIESNTTQNYINTKIKGGVI